MANLIKSLMRRALAPDRGNLVSVSDPYKVIANLLRNHSIKGILDAGASNGHISRRLLRLFPDSTVYAFEPNPMYAEVLEQLAKEDRRLVPQQMALSDQESMVNLNVTHSPGGSSLFKPGERLKKMYPTDSEISAVMEVKAVTIDQWVKSHDRVPIHLMKFDIQGGELRALQGAMNTIQTVTLLVYTEVLVNPLYDGGAIFSEVDMFLRECGFVMYDFFKPRYNSDGILMWGNAIFLHSKRVQMAGNK